MKPKIVRKFLKERKKLDRKVVCKESFPVKFYCIYSFKDNLIMFEPYAAIDFEVAKTIARDKIANSKLRITDVAIFHLFTVDYVTRDFTFVNEYLGDLDNEVI